MGSRVLVEAPLRLQIYRSGTLLLGNLAFYPFPPLAVRRVVAGGLELRLSAAHRGTTPPYLTPPRACSKRIPQTLILDLSPGRQRLRHDVGGLSFRRTSQLTDLPDPPLQARPIPLQVILALFLLVD
ncbi:hypothetical protein B296_00011350 [Ensete ventricosum]|uniref:Uncharacterized protein n=1 Tax=Ensete ventricosum TaxID=4639 RepID=A0A427A980_ENSVE|nr:hypothetical protein B296_00011350 [Ensete ventricosum]